MDSSGSSSKKQKTNQDQDIISNLPDVIIGRILSFLPTKEAVSTCVLSKRWINLWTFITKLHFNDKKQYYHTKISTHRFISNVYGVLLQWDTARIQSFTLSLSKGYDSSHVDQWISTLLSRGVKEIFLDSNHKLDISSHSLWKSQSLEKLVLNMSGCAIRLPSFVRLSSLTVLNLSTITFTCFSQNLSLNFPVLREYKAQNCTWLNVKDVTLEVPLLEVLLIRQQVPVLLSGELQTVFKFRASRLTQFSYCGYGLPNTILLDLDTTCIGSAYFEPWCYSQEGDEKSALFAYDLLKQINHVECLKFRSSKALAKVQYDIPAFGLLSRLELGNVNGEILLKFLRNTPFLKTLIFQGPLQFGEELSNPKNVPSCFTSNLEVLKFGILNGDEHELRFAKFVIEFAKVLKGASFSRPLKLRLSKFEEFRKKILSCKRCARSAFIEFL